MPTVDRLDRIGALIQSELAKIIQREMQDKRMSMVTITGVDVSRDLSHAKIFVSVLSEDQDSVNELVGLLNESSKLLRFRLANEISLRSTPQLKFYYDETIAQGNKISTLISQLMKDDKNNDD
jgi:ribosome-binding factor A